MKQRVLSFSADIAFVMLFVFIGTRNHDTDKDAAGLAATIAPFLMGVVVGWMSPHSQKNPTAVSTGIVVWISTIALGMLLRHFVWDRGTAGAFVVVASVFNAFTLIGWRVVRDGLASRRLD